MACGTQGTEEKPVQSLDGKSEAKRPLGRPTDRREVSTALGVK